MAGKGDIDKLKVQPDFCNRWSFVKFEQILEKTTISNKLKTSEYWNEGTYAVIDQGNEFVAGYIMDETLLYKGELPVVVFGDHTKVIKYIDFKFAVGADGTKVLKTRSEINEKFFYYYLKALNIPDFGYSRHYSVLKYLDFPILSKEEQERIANKLDGLFARIEVIKKSMDKIPQLLKDFRQQVLTSAVTGKLTEEWREGKELEIDLGYIEGYLARMPRWKKLAQAESVNIVCAKEWSKVKLGNVAYISNGATPSRKNDDYWNGEIAWIGSSFIQNNRISYANEFITKKGFDETSVRLLPKGTVLIAMIGEGKTRAQSSILDIPSTINQNIASIEIGHEQILSEFLHYFLMANYDLHRTIGNGSGPKALNCQRVKEFDFVLPSIAEQEEIVRRVESLFAKADRIEEQYKVLKEKIDVLPQLLLHKAFKGELVEQLPTDGDAAELLKEIMALKKK